MTDRARHRSKVAQKGYTQIENAVLLDPRLSFGARILYAALKHFAWINDGEVPGVRGLALAIGCNERSLRDRIVAGQLLSRGYIGELVDAQLVTVERTVGESFVYIIEEPATVDILSTPTADKMSTVLRTKSPHTPISEDVASKEATKTRPPRKRDVVWDTLVDLFGEPTNDVERGRRNRTVRLIKQSLAAMNVAEADQAVEIRRRHARWSRVYERATITDTALSNRWSELGPRITGQPPQPKPCDYCGGRDGGHLADCVRPRPQLARREAVE